MEVQRRVVAVALCSSLVFFGQRIGKRVEIDDLLSLRSVTALAAAPEGTRIVYGISGKLYVLRTASGSQPVPMGAGTQPAWKPDGKAIAYDAQDGGSSQVWIAGFSGEAPRRVSRFQNGLDPSSPPSWSPDGGRLAVAAMASQDLPAPAGGSSAQVFGPEAPALLSSRGIFRAIPPDPDPIRREVFILSTDSDQLQKVSSAAESAAQPAWSPVGDSLVFVSRKDLANTGSELIQISVATGQRTVLASSPVGISSPRWSPDGRQVAYLADAGQYGLFTAVWVVDARAGAVARNLSRAVDRSVVDFDWSADGRSLLAELFDGVNQPVGRLSFDDRFIPLTHGDAGRSMPRASQDATIWVESDPKHFQRILLIDRDSGEPAVLADANPKIDGWPLGDQKVVRWRNLRGETMEGVILLPPGYNQDTRVPLIVDPYSHLVNDFKRIPLLGSQYLAAQGYAVFMPNHRGFFSFPQSLKGTQYAQVAQLPESNDIMADDVLSGVDQLVTDGIADPNRLGLFSFSTGASAIEVLLTKTNRFRAAVCAGGVSDWIHYYLLRPPSDNTIPRMLDGRTPWDAPDLYRALSPIYQANRIRTPLLLAVGDQDSRLLDAVGFYQALRRLHRNVTLVRYPDQGHGFAPDPLRDYLKRSIAFFRANGL